MADERDELHSAAAALDGGLTIKRTKPNVTNSEEAETLPEDMTEAPERRERSLPKTET